MDPENSDTGEAERDYSYDAVHDDLPVDEPLSEHHPAPVTVTTETDYDAGDYSYDLAHEIPRSDA